MKIVVRNKSIISCEKPETRREIFKKLEFPNPEYEKLIRMGKKAYNIEKIIKLYEVSSNGTITCPRGFAQQCINIAKKFERVEIVDETRKLPCIDITFNGELRGYQEKAVNEVVKRKFGCLVAPTGSGKTVMAAAIIAKRRQPALVICHTRELLNQWVERLSAFLSIPVSKIGIIGDSKFRIGDIVTIGMVQSLKGRTDSVRESIGFLILDECHHCPASSFSEVVCGFDSAFQLGLTATAFRRDKLNMMIWRYLGDKTHEIQKEELIESGHVCKAIVEQVGTEFNSDIDGTEYYPRLVSELCFNKKRNDFIGGYVADFKRNNIGTTLVLSDRKEHCRALKIALQKNGIDAEILTADVKKNDRIRIVNDINSKKIDTIIGTSQLLSEGFDCKAISHLIFASPIRFEGKITQSLGRALRPDDGKEYAYIIDFVDNNVDVLRYQGIARKRFYEKEAGLTLK